MKLGRKIYPFALRRTYNDEWVILNKHENPIGTTPDYGVESNGLPVAFRFKSLGEQKLMALAYEPDAVIRDSHGRIKYVQLYELDKDVHTQAYYERLMLLDTININQINR